MLWKAHDIQARVAELGQDISTDFDGRPVLILGVATGVFMFLADLVRHIALPLQVDIVRVQSYGNGMKTSGVATISTDCKIDLKDKHIIVVEDMIDTGTTLAKLVTHLTSKGAASVSVCVLLDKVSRRAVPLKLSGMGKCYVGFECPDYFIVGYGMDYAERFRSLPCIGVLKPEVYQQKAL